MSKRMQVVMDEAEYRRIQRVAESRGLTLAGWVRRVLERASREESIGDADRKLAAVRAAVRHSYPSGDLAGMLAEIESGYMQEDSE